jgi:hypothetical protein
VFDEEQLRELGRAERLRLIRALVALESPAPVADRVFRRRQVPIICLVVLATLLCCDAWFDVVLDARTAGFELSTVRRGHRTAAGRPGWLGCAAPAADDRRRRPPLWGQARTVAGPVAGSANRRQPGPNLGELFSELDSGVGRREDRLSLATVMGPGRCHAERTSSSHE